MSAPGSGHAVRFVEVGPRDGFQNWPQPVSTDTKEHLVRGSLAAGIDCVEATSFVSPRWVPQMADAAELMRRLADETERLRVLVPNLRGLELALAAGSRRVLVNVGVTDGFNQRNLNRTVEATLDEIRLVCSRGEDAGVRVDGSLSVAFGCPFDGPVSTAQAMTVARRLMDAGCASISLADTIGVANPASVRALAQAALREFGAERVAMHFHDTRGMGLANVMCAAECGVAEFEGSVGGIGGCPFAPRSTGNICTEDCVLMLERTGYTTGVDVARLATLARDLSAELEQPLPGHLHRAGLEPWLTTGAVA